jgi:hypothetical protein
MTFSQRVKNLLTQPRLVVNLLLLSGFSAFWIRDFLYWLPKDMYETSLNYWAFTDWLIDYSQGFIRRGLSGEMWRLIPDSVNPLHFVAIFSWVLILLVISGYIRLLVRSSKSMHPLILFGILVLPSLFVFYLHDHNTIARKEILGYIVILLHLLLIEKSFPLSDGEVVSEGNLRRYVRWLIPLNLILLPAIILVHEGNFLLFVPIQAMMTLSIFRIKSRPKFIQAALWTGLLYLPALIAFVAVYLSGTPEYTTLLGLCQKWLDMGAVREGSCNLRPEPLSGSTLPASLIPMDWSLKEASEITTFVISMQWKAWLTILPTLGIMLWYLNRQVVYSILHSRFTKVFSPRSARHYVGSFFLRYFLIPFLFMIPVFFSAYDYGRWFTVACANFTMLAVSIHLPAWEFAHSKEKYDNEIPTSETRNYLDPTIVFYGISIIICILAVILMLPHYCIFECQIMRSPLEFFSLDFIPN